ncbi:hypothetical protein [Bradyrhizobium sp. SZCCHNRI3042]|uniref:hypothetical protein n=1 Tax=Bradyrhizobium sp. SZCCHNRI3042 TaxID=3057291 RepID=UPI0029163085|nr:hypothetical protein [Bradyrhizobium sp. SZCCHNRI3042]
MRRRHFAGLLGRFAIAGFAAVLLSEVRTADAQGIDHPLCVRNFNKIALTDADVDDILSRASAILSDVGVTRLPCQGVKLSRQGNVAPFDESVFPRSLALESEFPKFTGDACVKVVERIIWCGGLVPGALGCAPVPGQGLIVVRRVLGLTDSFNREVEPVTWLHEFGHTRGLQHNPIDSLSVMAPGLGPTNRSINDSECTVLASTVPAAGAAPLAAAMPMPAGGMIELAQATGGAPQSAEAARMPVEEFVKQTFVHNPPLENLKQYEGDLPKVQEMLFDPKFSAYRSNIIVLLGAIGNKDTIPLLSKIIDTNISPDKTDVDIGARLAAPLAMGTIANRNNLPEKDIAILRRASQQGFWEQRLTLVKAPSPGSKGLDDDDVRALSRDLAIQSTRGYAISGSEEVRSKLQEEHAGTVSAALPEPVRQEQLSILNDALKLNKTSKEMGAYATFAK